MTTKDLKDIEDEYYRKIDGIMLWALDNDWFNTTFITQMKYCLNDYKFLTPEQQLGIDNIIEKFDISW